MGGMCAKHQPKDSTCVQTGNEICMFCGHYIIKSKRLQKYVNLTSGTQKKVTIFGVGLWFTWNGKDWLKS